MRGRCACRGLPRLKFSCLDFLKIVVQLSTRLAHAAPRLVHAAANKIEFNYLNGNLMVPKIHPLNLNFERNSRKGG
jgi:hypothetical protein